MNDRIDMSAGAMGVSGAAQSVDYPTLVEVRKAPFACRYCDGHGQWGVGPCEPCQGSGDQACEYCTSGNPAVARWKDNRAEHYLCLSCHEEWIAEELS